MSVKVKLRFLYFDDDIQFRGSHETSGLYATTTDALTAIDGVYSDLQDQVNKQGGYIFVENSTGGEMPPKMIRPSRRHRVVLPGENN